MKSKEQLIKAKEHLERHLIEIEQPDGSHMFYDNYKTLKNSIDLLKWALDEPNFFILDLPA